MRSSTWLLLMLAPASLLMLVALGQVATATEVEHFSDDFNTADGPLHAHRWTVSKALGASNVTVNNRTARVVVYGTDRVVAAPDVTMDACPFETEFMWSQKQDRGHTMELQVATSEGGKQWTVADWFFYDAEAGSWFHGDPTGPGAYRTMVSDLRVETDTWYRVGLTVNWSRVTFRLYGASGDEPLLETEHYSVMEQYITVRVGAWVEAPAVTSALVDDFRVYEVDTNIKDPIRVDPIPPVRLVEDVERTLDLSPYVHDPDGDISDIHVETSNYWVVERWGLNVTILCPMDGGVYTLVLMFTDGERFTDVHVSLDIEGVNDPPQLTLVAPIDGITLRDVDGIRVEFSVEDPDSESWTAHVAVRGEGSAYLWETEEDVLNSPHSLQAAPSIGQGTYFVEVVLTDGKAQDSKGSTVHVKVTEPEVPSADETSRQEYTTPFLLGVFVAALIIATITMAFATRLFRHLSRSTHEASRARRHAKKAWSASHRPPPQHQVPPPLVVHSRSAPANTRPTKGPVGDWRVTSVEEFLEIIPNLPQGFPQPLWGIPQEQVGEQVVRTSTVGPDGGPCCHVDGRAYHADKRDLETFLRPL